MVATSLFITISLHLVQVVSGQYKSAVAFYIRDGFKVYGAQLIATEFRSPSLINCNLRCLRSENCVATNFQLLDVYGGGHCELLLPHDIDDGRHSVVFSKQLNTVYTRIKSEIPAKTEMLETKREEEANPIGLPISYQASIVPSYPAEIKESTSSIFLPVLNRSPTSSASVSLPETDRKETTCSLAESQSYATATKEIIIAESVSFDESTTQKWYPIKASSGPASSVSPAQILPTPLGVPSVTGLLPHSHTATSELGTTEGLAEESSSLSFPFATSVITATMSAFSSQGEDATHVPSSSLQSINGLSTLTYECERYFLYRTCYAIIKASVSWAAAKTACESSNGQLAMITSSSKLNSLKQWLQASNDITSIFHVGIYKNKDSSSVKWANGQTLYSWYNYQYITSNACSTSDCCGTLSLNRNDFYMLADSCNNAMSYICQWRG